MAADGPAVGVGGDDGLPGHFHDVPERRVGQMAHICQNAQPLRFLYPRPAHIGKTLFRMIHMAARQIVPVVPGDIYAPYAPLGRRLQLFRLAAEKLAPFDGQQRRDFSRFVCLPDAPSAGAEGDKIAVFLQLR